MLLKQAKRFLKPYRSLLMSQSLSWVHPVQFLSEKTWCVYFLSSNHLSATHTQTHTRTPLSHRSDAFLFLIHWTRLSMVFISDSILLGSRLHITNLSKRLKQMAKSKYLSLAGLAHQGKKLLSSPWIPTNYQIFVEACYSTRNCTIHRSAVQANVNPRFQIHMFSSP